MNADFDDVNPSDYDALLIPGGRAPEYIRLNSKVIEIVKDFFKQNKPVAAICHGPQVLAAAGVLNGRKCTSYPAVAPDVRSAGADWVDVGIDGALVDGNLVTAQAWPGHPQWLLRFIELLDL